MSDIEDLRNEIKVEFTKVHEALGRLFPMASDRPSTVTPQVVSSDHPSLLETGNQPAPGVFGAVNPSPFADDADPEAGDRSGGTTNDQLPAQSTEATSVGPTTADTVVNPATDVTPHTENPPTEDAADESPSGSE